MRKSQKAWRCARIGVSGDAKASLSAASGRSGLGACSERSRIRFGAGPIGTATQRFRRVWIAWQAQHFGKVGRRFPGRRSIFARSSKDFVAGAALSARSSTYFVAGAALSHGQVQILWQAQRFRKVKCRICGRCSTFAGSSAEFVAGATLSQGQIQISWQAQHFGKVRHRFRGRCSTFARSSAALKEREIDR